MGRRIDARSEPRGANNPIQSAHQWTGQWPTEVARSSMSRPHQGVRSGSDRSGDHGQLFPLHGAEPGQRWLFVASTGGHLTQLFRIAPRLRPAQDSAWVTFDSPQSRSLLKDEHVHYVPYIGARDPINASKTFRRVRALLAREQFDAVVSTGSAISVGAFAAAKAKGIPTHFIESFSRINGPSLSGRIVARSGLAGHLYSQHGGWADHRWRLVPSVLASYKTIPAPEPREVRKVFVALGTMRQFRFDALIDALKELGVLDRATVQYGATARSDLSASSRVEFDNEQYTRACLDADVVVAHAGVGSIIEMLDLGVCPVVVPRSRERGEHVDDHQKQICALLEGSRLGVVRSAERLTFQDLHMAANRRTLRVYESALPWDKI